MKIIGGGRRGFLSQVDERRRTFALRSNSESLPPPFNTSYLGLLLAAGGAVRGP
jgi:hypothetical protein